jgi:hypothetical protein
VRNERRMWGSVKRIRNPGAACGGSDAHSPQRLTHAYVLVTKMLGLPHCARVALGPGSAWKGDDVIVGPKMARIPVATT